MFDLGFSELLVIGVVALVVLGPERLPKAARFVGLWVRRARNQWNSVRTELEREIAAEDLKKNLDAGREAMRDMERSIRDHGAAADAEARRLRDKAVDGLPIDTGRRRMEADATAAALQAEAASGDAADDAASPGQPAPAAPVAMTPTDVRDDGPAVPQDLPSSLDAPDPAPASRDAGAEPAPAGHDDTRHGR